MNDSDFFDGEATRIATVHPQTGVEFPVHQFTQMLADNADDATTIYTREPMLQSAPQSTTEFIPSRQSKATGEITLPWRPNVERAAGLKNQLQRHNRKIAIFLFLLLAAVSTLCYTMQAERPWKKSSSPPNRIVSSGTDDHSASDPQDELKTPATLSDAATSLINGEFQKARREYRYLAEKYPSDASFKLAVTILETQEEYQ